MDEDLAASKAGDQVHLTRAQLFSALQWTPADYCASQL